MQDRELLGCGEAARRSGVTPPTFKRWLSEGRIPFLRVNVGRRRLASYVVYADDLEAYLEKEGEDA